MNVWPWRVFHALRSERDSAHMNSVKWRQRFLQIREDLAVARAVAKSQESRIERLELDLESARADLRRAVEDTRSSRRPMSDANFADLFAEDPRQSTVFVDHPGATAADIAEHVERALTVRGDRNA